MGAALVPILLIAYPLAEIATFIVVGQEVGVLGTLGLLLAAGLLGAVLLRWQGFSLILRIRNDVERGVMPAEPLMHGVLMALAGLFLLLPGFLSDILAFLLLLPFVRDLIISQMRRRMTVVTRFERENGVVDLDPDDFDEVDPDRPGGSPWRGGSPRLPNG